MEPHCSIQMDRHDKANSPFHILWMKLTKILRLFHFHQPSIIPCMYKVVQNMSRNLYALSTHIWHSVKSNSLGFTHPQFTNKKLNYESARGKNCVQWTWQLKNNNHDNKLTANVCVSLVICSGYWSTIKHSEYAQQLRVMSECSYTWIEIIATNPALVTAEERLAVVSNEAATGGGAFNSQAGPFNLGGGN